MAKPLVSGELWARRRHEMSAERSTFTIREIKQPELAQLLELYRFLHPDDPGIEIDRSIQQLWESILKNPSLHYLGAYAADDLVSTCTLTIIPNLTRGARPYAVIENVVTHPQFRRRGMATQVLQHALLIAWAQGCYKVMLQTGTKQESTLRFYEKAGFRRGDKTGFVAHPPSG
jgi:GNAT superfamily N-acetyltransferase